MEVEFMVANGGDGLALYNGTNRLGYVSGGPGGGRSYAHAKCNNCQNFQIYDNSAYIVSSDVECYEYENSAQGARDESEELFGGGISMTCKNCKTRPYWLQRYSIKEHGGGGGSPFGGLAGHLGMSAWSQDDSMPSFSIGNTSSSASDTNPYIFPEA